MLSRSVVSDCDPWTVAYQAPLSMGFSRQENRNGLPFPLPADLPNPGIDPTLQAEALPSEPPGKPHFKYKILKRFYNVSELRSLTLIEILVFNNKYPG